jgi:anti-sigma B factor antagonist
MRLNVDPNSRLLAARPFEHAAAATGGRLRGAPIALCPRLVADAAIVEVVGQIDRSTAPALRDELRRAASSGNGTVIVDLLQTGLIDSTGLSILLNAQRRLTREGRTLRVVCPEGPVRRMLAVTRLMETLGVCETLDAALDHGGQTCLISERRDEQTIRSRGLSGAYAAVQPEPGIHPGDCQTRGGSTEAPGTRFEVLRRAVSMTRTRKV